MNAPGGFYRGNLAREQTWKTDSKRAQFTTPTTLDATALDRRVGRCQLITLRSNDQFNTTVYGDSDRLRGVHGSRKIVMMSPEDIEEAGLKAGAEIALVTDIDDGYIRRVGGLKVTPYDLPKGALVGSFSGAQRAFSAIAKRPRITHPCRQSYPCAH